MPGSYPHHPEQPYLVLEHHHPKLFLLKWKLHQQLQNFRVSFCCSSGPLQQLLPSRTADAICLLVSQEHLASFSFTPHKTSYLQLKWGSEAEEQGRNCFNLGLTLPRPPLTEISDTVSPPSVVSSVLPVAQREHCPALSPCFVLCADAFLTPAQPESAIPDIPEHERQLPAGPAPQQPLHPNQHQLQFTGKGLPKQ